MLDMAILGLLRERALHGYELRRRLIDLGFWRISFGSIYPGLRRLERNGWITVQAAGARRKEYRITQAGEAHLLEVLGDETAEVDNSNAFRVRLALFRYLPPATRVLFLRRRQEVLRRRLETIDATLRGSGVQLDRYSRAEMEHRAETAAADIAWLQGLIDLELSGQRPARRRNDTASTSRT